MTLNLPAPAKVNLFLRVLRRRPDGYHDLRTVFERVDLCDRITLKKRSTPEIRLRTDSKDIPSGADNLAFRAASLLQKEFHVGQGADLFLQKKIPIAAGLGGGSSDAATVLLGLKRLWKLKIPHKRLLLLGARLGSDVPFFLLNTPFALGGGRGEKLKIVSAPRARFWHCIVKPPFGISTREAYRGLDLKKLTGPGGDVKMLLQSIQKGRPRETGKLLDNSLELSLGKRVRTIFNLKKKLLEAGALGALLSGSGSAVFGLFDSKKAATRAAAFLGRNRKWKVFVARTF